MGGRKEEEREVGRQGRRKDLNARNISGIVVARGTWNSKGRIPQAENILATELSEVQFMLRPGRKWPFFILTGALGGPLPSLESSRPISNPRRGQQFLPMPTTTVFAPSSRRAAMVASRPRTYWASVLGA